jgi:uncharacterized protein (TIGR03083 family)
MEYAEYLPVIIEQARVLADAAREMEPDTKVPSCPEWDVAKLVRHTGTAHRWSRGVVQTREPLSPKAIDLAIPEDAQELPDWLEQSAALLVETLAATDPDGACWTWTNARDVRFWSRRMAHETAVHRWDGQGARGSPEPFAGALAVDGIDEHLENLPFIVGAERTVGAGETMHLHCTDRDGEWLLRLGAAGLEVGREHAKGDVALKGSASELFLVVLGRAPATAAEVFGDPAGLEVWQPLLGF